MSLMDNALGNLPPFFNLREKHESFAQHFADERTAYDIKFPSGWYTFIAKTTGAGCKFWSQIGPFADQSDAEHAIRSPTH